SKLGSICVQKKSSFWRASTHHEEPTRGGSVAGHLAKPGTALTCECTQNIMLQHRGEDPTGKPDTPLSAALTLQQCLFRGLRREVPPTD
ncbi:hypothetical protein TNCV_1851251, partial [Trichonephila clavipes]